jgi:hypothetical protein
MVHANEYSNLSVSHRFGKGLGFYDIFLKMHIKENGTLFSRRWAL